MKCKCRIIKLFAALVFAVVAYGFVTDDMNQAVLPVETTVKPFSDSLAPSAPPMPNQIFIKEVVSMNSTPLAYLFQILFFLFLISPPLIALMLFLIWKELKNKNDLK